MTDIQALAKELNAWSAVWLSTKDQPVSNEVVGRILEIAETFAARILELEAGVETANRYRDAVAGRKNHYKDLNRQCQLRNMELARELDQRGKELHRYDGAWERALRWLEEGGHMRAAWHLEQLPLSGRPIPQPQTVHDTFTNEVEDGWGDDPSTKWMVSTKIPRADFTAEKVADIVRQHNKQALG